MSESNNTQDTQEQINADVNQEAQNVQNDSTQQEISVETPVKDDDLKLKLEKAEKELADERRRLSEESQKRAVIEARYNEVSNIRSQNANPLPKSKSLHDEISEKVNVYSQKIIDDPTSANQVLTEALVTLGDQIKNDAITQASFINDVNSIMSGIKKDKPHLAIFEGNIKTRATELLRNGNAITLNDALQKAGDELNGIFESYSKTKTGSNMDTTKPEIGRGSEGVTSPQRVIVKPKQNEEYTPPEKFIDKRSSLNTKKRI